MENDNRIKYFENKKNNDIKTYRFTLLGYVDIKAKDEDTAIKYFSEMDLNNISDIGFTDVYEI